MRPIAVLGAGAFGTALAVTMAQTGRSILLWGRSERAVAAMMAARANEARLPGVAFPESLAAIASLADIPQSAVLILAVPAQETEAFLQAHGAALPRAPLVLAAKGLCRQSGRRQSEVAAACLPGHPLAVLSGPGFAGEIARGLPTALTLACADKVLASQLQARLGTPTLRLYTNADVPGVELGGALKNVVALACGMCAGADLGESARAALMTRGFAEMQRLAAAIGAEPATLAGLSGLGDLALSAAT
ncbi:MAG: NAD(P)H-dependent glycerol-3-phosphate dehydrogenase, partial [Pseudomonadota bacterium]